MTLPPREFVYCIRSGDWHDKRAPELIGTITLEGVSDEQNAGNRKNFAFSYK
ncbi:hypothetical protein MOK15_19025 [Sphingobium sp. BYY-5]|uniref:hypothetical protein n=1 Tax=Sphingobium sp. BYY-5 TaxID=2926400 RepID=UPI001FA6EFB3|nr:hypothetical protein [Sphingobium sp. BYY-5]MCI4592180.1 hypothetical protein [Sphingobium sp. BYY-5]